MRANAFSFWAIDCSCSKTRNLVAGTLIGSGTVSNEDSAAVGFRVWQKRE